MKPQMPKGEAPVTREIVDQVKRKMAPPPGPPPAGMANFVAPKTYAPLSGQYRTNRNENQMGQYDNEYDDGRNYERRSFNYDDNHQEQYYSDEEYDNRDRNRQGRYISTNHEEDDEELNQSDDSPLRNKYGKHEYRGNFNDDEDDYSPNGQNHQKGHNFRQNDQYGGQGQNTADESDQSFYQTPQDRQNNDSFYDSRRDNNNHGQAEPKNRQQYQDHNADAPGAYHNTPYGGPSQAKGTQPNPNNTHQQQNSQNNQNTHNNNPQQAEAKPLTTANLQTSQIAHTNINNQSPGRIVLFNFSPILRATYRELKQFVTTPCTYGITTRCYIERNRSGSHMLAPYYSVCADLEDGTGRELMVCRKVMYSQSAHYIFSLKADDLFRKREQRSKLYLGKLRAVSANDYVLYDNGICDAPEDFDENEDWANDGADSKHMRDNTALAKKVNRDAKQAKGTPSTDEISLYRKELLAIHFNCKTRPAVGLMRGTEVCIPNTFPSPEVSVVLGTEGTKGLTSEMKLNTTQVNTINKSFEKVRSSGKQNEMMTRTTFVLHEKTSKYDPLSSCLVDFKGRANVASVKNCQFVYSDPIVPSHGSVPNAEQSMKIDAEKEFILQLGKTTEDCFNMDYRYPLSLLQAFAVCIARFDAKLTW